MHDRLLIGLGDDGFELVGGIKRLAESQYPCDGDPQ